jgi:hypothetical protein
MRLKMPRATSSGAVSNMTSTGTRVDAVSPNLTVYSDRSYGPPELMSDECEVYGTIAIVILRAISFQCGVVRRKGPSGSP